MGEVLTQIVRKDHSISVDHIEVISYCPRACPPTAPNWGIARCGRCAPATLAGAGAQHYGSRFNRPLQWLQAEDVKELQVHRGVRADQQRPDGPG